MAEDVMTEIENEIRNNKVVMYMKGTPAFRQCGFSAATTEILQGLGKPFHTVDVLSSPEKRDDQALLQLADDPAGLRERQVHRRLRHRPRAAPARRTAAHRGGGVRGLVWLLWYVPRQVPGAPDAAALRASRPSTSEALGGLLAGGSLYTLGALIYVPRRPDPFPDVFGLGRIGTWLTSSHASVATA